MEPIIVVGGGGHAKVLINILKRDLIYYLIGYTDFCDNGKILDVGYLGTDDVLPKYFERGVQNIAIGVGQIKDADNRYRLVDKVKNYGFNFPAIISKKAIVSEDVYIGIGAQIFDGAIINSGTKVGEFSIINTGAILEHDCIVDDFTFLAPNATVLGGASIGLYTFVGSNSTILPGITIGKRSIIGAGAVVTKDVPDRKMYAGVPAVEMK